MEISFKNSKIFIFEEFNRYIFAGVAGLLITLVAGTFILTLICWVTMLVNRKLA